MKNMMLVKIKIWINVQKDTMFQNKKIYILTYLTWMKIKVMFGHVIWQQWINKEKLQPIIIKFLKTVHIKYRLLFLRGFLMNQIFKKVRMHFS